MHFVKTSPRPTVLRHKRKKCWWFRMIKADKKKHADFQNLTPLSWSVYRAQGVETLLQVEGFYGRLAIKTLRGSVNKSDLGRATSWTSHMSALTDIECRGERKKKGGVRWLEKLLEVATSFLMLPQQVVSGTVWRGRESSCFYRGTLANRTPRGTRR